jgi:hypothetical protein
VSGPGFGHTGRTSAAIVRWSMVTRMSSSPPAAPQACLRSWRWWTAGLVCLLGCLAAVWLASGESPRRSALAPRRMRFDFEKGGEAWTKERNSPGCIRLGSSRDLARDGEGSLEIQMYLDGEDPARQSGEAWVDVRTPSPEGKRPMDLTSRTVAAWVHAPQAAVGDPERPNGFQLFAKDERYEATFGEWQNVEPDRWVRLSLQLKSDPLAATDLVKGFRSDRIVLVGLKMATGARSSAIFDGSVFLDSVSW